MKKHAGIIAFVLSFMAGLIDAAQAANTALSALPAGAAISGTDLFYDVQAAGSGGVKVTGNQFKAFIVGTVQPLYFAQQTGACIWDGLAGHDVGPCINTTIANAAAAGGGTVMLPCGTFFFATQIVNNTNGVGVRGCGAGSYTSVQSTTTLIWNGAANQSPAVLIGNTATTAVYHVDWWGIAVDGNNSANIAIEFSEVNNSFINTACLNSKLINCWMTSATSGTAGSQENDVWMWAGNSSASFSPTGILLDGRGGWAAGNGNVSMNRFHSLESNVNGGDGIVFGYSDTNVVYFARTQHNNALLTGSQFVVANNNYTSPNGVAVAGYGNDLMVQFASSPIWVQGFIQGSVWTANGGNTGTAALNPTTISTNATTAAGNNVLHFASTTGVANGLSVNCGGSQSGVEPNTLVAAFTGTTVTMQVASTAGGGTPSGVASGTSCKFTYSVTSNAVPGTYTITAASPSTYNITAPAGGHTQSGLSLTGGVLVGLDLVVPLTGTPVTNDSFTLVVPIPASKIISLGTDKANSISDPYFEMGAQGSYQSANTLFPVVFTAGGTGASVGNSWNYGGSNAGVVSQNTNTISGISSWIWGSGNSSISSGGVLANIFGGIGNASNGFGTTTVGGSANTASGTFSAIFGGAQATDRGRFNSGAYGCNSFAAQGDCQWSRFILKGTGSSTSAIRLTGDGNAASSTNCVNIPQATSFNLQIKLIVIDHTTPTKRYTALWGYGTSHRMTRDVTNGTWIDGATTTVNPDTSSNDGLVPTAVTIAADTVNNCLNISWTPPAANTDTMRAVAYVETVEAQ